MSRAAAFASPSVLAAIAGAALLLLPAAAGAANDFSAAEQALFLGTPLAPMTPPQT